MARQPLVARRAEELLGSAVAATAPAAGGDVSTATKLRLSDGTTALIKTLSQAPDGFFAREAAGLRWLADADAVAVPDVLAVADDALVLRWVEPGRAGADAADRFGAELARLHGAGADGFGADENGFIGRLPMRNDAPPEATWADFYATRRVLPYLKLAHDRGAATDTDRARIEAFVGRLPTLVPEEPPARLHGDLWNGNAIWGADGRVWLVDPAAYGGHREVDLAMLALFGLPHFTRVVDGYQAETPLADGWEERLGVHQVFPLLVHACMFGGGYAARAAALAERST